MPVLFFAPTLIITDLKKAFTVFGLMFIRLAICFVLRSWIRRLTVSLSRSVRRNFGARLWRLNARRWLLSSKRASAGRRAIRRVDFIANARICERVYRDATAFRKFPVDK